MLPPRLVLLPLLVVPSPMPLGTPVFVQTVFPERLKEFREWLVEYLGSKMSTRVWRAETFALYPR